MWDSARALNAIANLLYAGALAALLLAAALWGARQPAFSLERVEVVGGMERTTAEQVHAVVARDLSGTFFTVDLARLRSGFEKLPWVRTVRITRRWPARLNVDLEEHRVLARWNERALVNVYGEVFDAAYDGDLPALSGPEGTAREVAQRYVAARAALARVDLEPAALALSERGAWRLTLGGGTRLELGREQLDERIGRYVAAYREGLSRLSFAVEYVDLRYPHGFAVRVPKEFRDAPKDRGTQG
ncbi:MAG: cell division protein FtsQ/DivIB [Pseudomonadota bacterium]